MNDPRKLSQELLTITKGMDSGRSPSIIGQDQVAFAVNVTFRDGYTTSRPGWKKVPITFANQEEQDWFRSHASQGADVFNPYNGESLVVCSVGGRAYALNVTDNEIQSITPPDGGNAPNNQTAWFCQAQKYLIIQDGQSLPIIWDGGSNARRSNIADEVPVGKQMAYGQGRLFVVTPNGRQIAAGDFAGIGDGSVLKFTEINSLNGGGLINPVVEGGPFTALKFTAKPNTVAGQGPLLAFTPTVVTAYNPIPQRELWNTIDFSQVSLISNGAIAQASTTIVNGDVFYRSVDGIRSFVMAQRDFSNQWGNVPQSREMDRIISNDPSVFMNFASSTLFDNRLLVTCIPRPVDENACIFQGLIALNFDNVSSMYSKLPPAYDGVWTGLDIYQIVTGVFSGVERCFALVRGQDDDHSTEVWELTKDDPFDNGNCEITSSIETGSYIAGNPKSLKRLMNAEIFLDKMKGDAIEIDLKYRPDEYPCWIDWQTLTDCAAWEDCVQVPVGQCHTLREFKPQYRPRMTFDQPPNQCDSTLSKRLFRSAYSFQFRIAWTGHLRIKQFVMNFYLQDDLPQDRC